MPKTIKELESDVRSARRNLNKERRAHIATKTELTTTRRAISNMGADRLDACELLRLAMESTRENNKARLIESALDLLE